MTTPYQPLLNALDRAIESARALLTQLDAEIGRMTRPTVDPRTALAKAALAAWDPKGTTGTFESQDAATQGDWFRVVDALAHPDYEQLEGKLQEALGRIDSLTTERQTAIDRAVAAEAKLAALRAPLEYTEEMFSEDAREENSVFDDCKLAFARGVAMVRAQLTAPLSEERQVTLWSDWDDDSVQRDYSDEQKRSRAKILNAARGAVVEPSRPVVDRDAKPENDRDEMMRLSMAAGVYADGKHGVDNQRAEWHATQQTELIRLARVGMVPETAHEDTVEELFAVRAERDTMASAFEVIREVLGEGKHVEPQELASGVAKLRAQCPPGLKLTEEERGALHAAFRKEQLPTLVESLIAARMLQPLTWPELDAIEKARNYDGSSSARLALVNACRVGIGAAPARAVGGDHSLPWRVDGSDVVDANDQVVATCCEEEDSATPRFIVERCNTTPSLAGEMTTEERHGFNVALAQWHGEPNSLSLAEVERTINTMLARRVCGTQVSSLDQGSSLKPTEPGEPHGSNLVEKVEGPHSNPQGRPAVNGATTQSESGSARGSAALVQGDSVTPPQPSGNSGELTSSQLDELCKHVTSWNASRLVSLGREQAERRIQSYVATLRAEAVAAVRAELAGEAAQARDELEKWNSWFPEALDIWRASGANKTPEEARRAILCALGDGWIASVKLGARPVLRELSEHESSALITKHLCIDHIITTQRPGANGVTVDVSFTVASCVALTRAILEAAQKEKM